MSALRRNGVLAVGIVNDAFVTEPARAAKGAGASAMQSVPAVRERLLGENWEFLLEQAERFAQKEVRSRRWRRTKGGVLPEGFDAKSVAAEAVAGLFNGECRLADANYAHKELEKEIQRLVQILVRRLHRRKENGVVANEWDILTADQEGEPRSIFKGLVDPGQESQVRLAELEELKEEFELFLKDEQLKEVFRCLCSGVRSLEGIAGKLGISILEAKRLRRRLEERRRCFGARHIELEVTELHKRKRR